jgi:hypothetical protein
MKSENLKPSEYEDTSKYQVVEGMAYIKEESGKI